MFSRGEITILVLIVQGLRTLKLNGLLLLILFNGYYLRACKT